MPQPSSRTVEDGFRMEVVQRGFLAGVESHSAIRGVIFQRTVFYHIFFPG